MNLGNTLEEKEKNYILLNNRLEKWGKGIGLFLTAIYVIMALSLGKMSLGKSGFGVVMLLLSPLLYKFLYKPLGKFYYLGFLKMKIWFQKKNIGASDVTGAIADSVTFSYLLDNTVATPIFLWIIMLCGGWLIAFWSGVIDYIKIKGEAKRLGFDKKER